MPLSWNEIRARAIKFSKEWDSEHSEDAESKSFIDGLFSVFGVSRRRLASFEKRVKKIDGKDGYIDLLWKGVLLIEFKSRGKDLDRAYEQAKDYFPGLKDRDLPQYILVCDFARMRLYNLDNGEQHEFPLSEFYKHIRLFGFMAGYQTRSVEPEDPANIEAAVLMGNLHDAMEENGYKGHALEVYLVRLLFCVFADDTSIFERNQFREYIENKTAEDGHDLGHHLTALFHTLNTPEAKRQKNLDEDLAAFPYVNGKLFDEFLPLASFDSKMRSALLNCCALDWSRISPAIFGSLFQSVMDDKERRASGAHYTTEQNILKVVRALFLDDLQREFEAVRFSKAKLTSFHQKLSRMKFLDPACGCGNFLVITYRELRLLELEVLRELHKGKSSFLDVGHILWIDVDQFYGIELEEFPAQIAQVALWMVDHQMNMRISEEFGQYFRRLPLTKSPNICNGNALQIDWTAVVNPADLTFILGNPPFIGKQYQSKEQKEDLKKIFGTIPGAGVLDYVCGWYVRAAEFMRAAPHVETAFVSTNSITQGEQVGVLWPILHQSYGLKINFAHRTFRWTSEARGKAAVHVVVIGLALHDRPTKVIFDYETPESEPHAVKASQINPYLVDADFVWLSKQRTPIDSSAPPIAFGNMPNDGGHLLLSADAKRELLTIEPGAAKFVRRLMGSDELINSTERWCLWLEAAQPQEIRGLPAVLERVEQVRQKRLKSKRPSTRALASFPQRFGEVRQPQKTYLAIPEVSSENRHYIPIGFLSSDVIATNKLYTVDGASLYHFGVLTSVMHMAWVRAVSGRLESRYQYSAGIVYNNFPWPNPTEKQKANIEAAAQAVLDVRARFPTSSFADLYDPIATPAELTRAHTALDNQVDAAYGSVKFSSEMERVAYLIGLYEKLASPLALRRGKAKKRKPKSETA